MFPLMCNHQECSSMVGRDDRGLDISIFIYGVGTSHICAKQNTKVVLASLACVDMASKHKWHAL
jgi:hypothetical protein